WQQRAPATGQRRRGLGPGRGTAGSVRRRRAVGARLPRAQPALRRARPDGCGRLGRVGAGDRVWPGAGQLLPASRGDRQMTRARIAVLAVLVGTSLSLLSAAPAAARPAAVAPVAELNIPKAAYNMTNIINKTVGI